MAIGSQYHRTDRPGAMFITVRVIAIVIAIAGVSLLAAGGWIKGKALVSQLLLEQAFARSLEAGVAQRPWAWADMAPLARLSAPDLGQHAITLADASAEALAFGPGHLPNTPLPGERGTAVFAGHRDTHFGWIGHLKTGDRISVAMTNGDHLHYSVTGARVARYDQNGIDVDAEGSFLALTTCYPLDASGATELRYIVEAEMLSGEGAAAPVALLASP